MSFTIKLLRPSPIFPHRNYSKTPTHRLKKAVNWKSVVGLEVHAQISSTSKLFSVSSTKFSNPPNTNVSLFDAATPGTLPVLNKHCVEAGILTALSLNCRVNPVSYFDRKHYFYADMPAGYQITQQRVPLASEGMLNFHVFTPGVNENPYKTSARIKQLQLEQDSGKSLHESDRSLIDLNRAGVPLMEVVFEPDLVDGEEAAALVKELISILERIETCSCKMEEGALRVDANVSVHKDGEPLGIRTEIKNIGSVRGVAAAVKYEIERQIKTKEEGGIIVNETRAWNAERKVTVAMRDKEVQQDYRYMPEPNLPPLHVAMGPVSGGKVNADKIKSRMPELPEQTRTRLREDFGLNMNHSIILVNDFGLLKIFEGALSGRIISPTKLANFLMNELNQVLNERNKGIRDLSLNASHIGEIMELLDKGIINRSVATLILVELIEGKTENPTKIVQNNNWQQITDEEELRHICNEVLAENEKGVQQYLSGKSKVFKAFLGAVFKKSKTKADMKKCNDILKDLLAQHQKK